MDLILQGCGKIYKRATDTGFKIIKVGDEKNSIPYYH